MATFKDQTQEIATTGPNFDQVFGALDLSPSSNTPSSFVLTSPMTSDEIFDSFMVEEVSLSDVANVLATADPESTHLFFVKDMGGVTHAVYIFQEDGTWKIVSPTSAQGGRYQPGLIIWTL